MLRIFQAAQQSDDVNETMSAIRKIIANRSPSIQHKQLTIDIDDEGLIGSIPNSSTIWRCVDRILEMAIACCSTRGEITITLIDTQRAIEVEIAVSETLGDSNVEYPQSSAFSRKAMPRQLGRLESDHLDFANVRIYCVRCPQGGLAWTIVPSKTQEAYRVA